LTRRTRTRSCRGRKFMVRVFPGASVGAGLLALLDRSRPGRPVAWHPARGSARDMGRRRRGYKAGTDSPAFGFKFRRSNSGRRRAARLGVGAQIRAGGFGEVRVGSIGLGVVLQNLRRAANGRGIGQIRQRLGTARRRSWPEPACRVREPSEPAPSSPLPSPRSLPVFVAPSRSCRSRALV
jgi:hypothetical protein